MKAKIVNKEGKGNKKVDLPSCFKGPVREDIAQKYQEVAKKMQPYGQSPEGGRKYANEVRHARNKFRSHYGRGVSRVPRKIFWRRGTQFFWEAAGVPGVRGGRRAHPPKPVQAKKKINKKEKKLAIRSAIASTGEREWIKKRYDTVGDIKEAPIVVKSDILELGSNEFEKKLRKILGDLSKVAFKDKKVRSGKGKRRGRKYKKSAGALLIMGDKEECKSSIVEARKAKNLGIEDLWPLGRLTVYTEKAIEDLKEHWTNFSKNKGENKK